MPMSRPLALGDRKKDPGCPFTYQRPCQAKVQGILEVFFLSSCRARSRLGRSSKRIVFDKLFPHVGE